MFFANRRMFLKSLGSALVASSYAHPPVRAFAVQKGTLSLPVWQPGFLQIHHISTGRGSCALLIGPDGTTMMIDAGSIVPGNDPSETRFLINPRPNGSLRPGQWMAKYAQRCLAQAGREEIDYFLLTHFHTDHMGEIAPGDFETSPKSRFGNYQLGGLTDVAEVLPIKTLIDRNYPAYDYPTALDDPQMRNYPEFGRSLAQRGGRVERILPGADDQIVLTRERSKYPSFCIRNLAANGEVWTGVGRETRHHFPPLLSLARADYPTENKCSLAIRLSYGAFDYFSAGDMDHDTEYGDLAWGDIETPVAMVGGPVEVAVANHHGYVNACGPDWVRALRARAYVINGWDSAHPSMTSLDNMLSRRLYPDDRMIFSTATKPEAAIALKRMSDVTSQNGHIIIHVPPGGKSFNIFIRDSSMDEGPILAKYGPIACS
jgi:Metallo-beta-lactamase superfamily